MSAAQQQDDGLNRSATFTLNEKDLVNGMNCAIIHSIKKPTMFISLLVFWAVAMAIYPQFVNIRPSPVVAGVLLAGILLLATTLVPYLLGRLVIKKRLKSEKVLHESVAAHWTEEFYEARQASIQNRIVWKDYILLLENKHAFLFFPTTHNYQILPKRVLSPEQIADLQRILADFRSGASPASRKPEA